MSNTDLWVTACFLQRLREKQLGRLEAKLIIAKRALYIDRSLTSTADIGKNITIYIPKTPNYNCVWFTDTVKSDSVLHRK